MAEAVGRRSYSPEAEELGERMRIALLALMGARRMSMRALARELEMAESTLRSRLSPGGGARLSLEETAEIAHILGSSWEQLNELAQSERLVRIRCFDTTLTLHETSEQQLALSLNCARRPADRHLAAVSALSD